MTTALEGGEGSTSRLGHSLPPGKTRYPLYRRLGGPQDRSWKVQKMSPTPGFDPRIVQPVASRYTDWPTRPMCTCNLSEYYFFTGNLREPFHWLVRSALWSSLHYTKIHGNAGIVSQGRPQTVSCISFPVHCSLITLHSTLRSSRHRQRGDGKLRILQW